MALAAFGIDAWWDLRSQRADARAYIEAIRTEIVGNRQLLLGQLDTLHSWILESEGYLNSVVAPDQSPSYEQIAEMVWQTGPNRTPPIARAALDDLISSGGLSVIESPEIRRAIAEYGSALDRDAEEQDDVRLTFNTLVYPYHVEYGSFTEFPWEAYAGVPESPVSFRLDTSRFAGNRVYGNLLISRILEFQNLRDTHAAVIEQIDDLLGAIDEHSTSN